MGNIWRLFNLNKASKYTGRYLSENYTGIYNSMSYHFVFTTEFNDHCINLTLLII